MVRIKHIMVIIVVSSDKLKLVVISTKKFFELLFFNFLPEILFPYFAYLNNPLEIPLKTI